MKPGAVVYVGKKRDDAVTIDAISYTNDEETIHTNLTVSDALGLLSNDRICWININGIHNSEIIKQFGVALEIHDLSLEDIANSRQRPKLDEDKNSIFIVSKMLSGSETSTKIKVEQVSILFGKNWVLTFQEEDGDVFDYVRKRLINTKPRIRFLNPDYLAYALLDAIVDHYFIVLEKLGEDIESLDEEVTENPSPEQLNDIRVLKKQLVQLRKSVWPLREVVSSFDRTESDLVHKVTKPYIRDLYEHVIQVIDTVETYRDLVAGLLDLYHTGISNRMNEVMKTLTIFASIFIPLGFLAGVYGMNFDTSVSPLNLPELGFEYGYIMFWSLAVCIGGGLLLFFRKKNWF
ncbi:MAG: magnesium and cobalt transport protein CorA [Calditrichaeota bacterium]|nr:MAG: magnesium and cobalt transport protein CorA [Calditrichota bacterium]